MRGLSANEDKRKGDEERAVLGNIYQGLGLSDIQEKFYRDNVVPGKQVIFLRDGNYHVVTHAGNGDVFYGGMNEYKDENGIQGFLTKQLEDSRVIGFVPMTEHAEEVLMQRRIKPYL